MCLCVCLFVWLSVRLTFLSSFVEVPFLFICLYLFVYLGFGCVLEGGGGASVLQHLEVRSSYTDKQ